MEKLEIGGGAIFYPMPCSIVGATVQGKPNYITVAWFSILNRNPLYIGISLNKVHYTNPGIREHRTFSVNIPSRDMIEVTDYCGIVSGRKYDKADRFETFYGKSDTAPMIKECPYNMECILVETVDLPSNDLFIGEIRGVYTDARYLTEGVPDMKKIDPLILSMPQSGYFTVGEFSAKAWDTGKKLIRK
jgi:flavin reductase (DIM6/NTAB) family NADH-FMN oxidoreductase RutF